MILLQIIFWCCVILLLVSYFFYPLLVEIFSSGKKQNTVCFSKDAELPGVSVLLAVHNEESVIEQKIISTLRTSYPKSKIEFLIGSDASADRTEEIINKFSSQFPQIKLHRFEERTGKAGIMNQLAEKANGEILLLTDANVFFTEETIFGLAKHFKNDSIAMVAGNIVNPHVRHDGISKQESHYQVLENRLKYKEGILWGAMMGAFGGCYAVRKNFFSPTPQKFIVDDFYITLTVLEKGGKAITEFNAICYEDVSHILKEEFRRKSRIGAGNFQLIKRFRKLLSPAKGGIAFAFFCHKVLRWLGPFFILAAYLCSFVLAFEQRFFYNGPGMPSQLLLFYKICFWIQTILLLIPVIDFILSKLKIHLFGLRYISHFYMMNLALLNGFFKFLTGVKHNVWQPTQRNQSRKDPLG
ncbi:MAG TPA: glycosyltransferase [Chitinophagales bacterium]|nr:glycosyltransferase [Chitinophagales bacterium]